MLTKEFFGQIAPVENDTNYDELKRDAKMCLSLMSQGLLYPEQVPMALEVLKQVSGTVRWNVHRSSLSAFQCYLLSFYWFKPCKKIGFLDSP